MPKNYAGTSSNDKHYKVLLLHRYPLTMFAFVLLFVVPLAGDSLALALERWHYLLEDGAKLLGILTCFDCLAHF